jgi:hypothetical protein
MRRLSAIALLSAAAVFAAEGAKIGKAQLQSAGPLAFGPNGVLFIGDSAQAAVVAIETGDTTAKAAAAFEIKGINQKVADVLGTASDQILINDVIVNPASKNIYLSVSKGKGPDAEPAILRTDASGKIAKVALDNVKHSIASLPNAPDPAMKDRRGQSLRVETITDLAYVDGRVFVAGLSNEEFSSSLRAIPYPFAATVKTAGIEIFHGAHGRFETNAPVRTFVPYKVNGEDHILAAYTCTPLVKIPVKDLQPGAKVKGKTIAELGNRNRPLDMIVYSKGGQDYILMANSSRGVMKLPAANLDRYEAITAQTEKQGVPYETIESLKGIQQLDKLDDKHAVVLADADGSMDLRAIPLP